MKLSEILYADQIYRGSDHVNAVSGVNRAEDLERILSVVKLINNSLVLDEVLRLVVDYSIEVAKAERGFLLLADDEGELRCRVARNSGKESIPLDKVVISRTIVDDVHQTGESTFVENAQTDNNFDRQQSIVSLSLQTILCTPLHVMNEKVGVIYVDSRSILAVKKNEIIDLFEILAGQAAIAIKNAQLYERLSKAYKDLEDANEQVLKFERLASRGEMAAEVGHELNNSLSISYLQLQSLKRSLQRDTPAQREGKIDSAITELKKTIQFTSGLVETSAFKTNKYLGNVNDVIQDFIRFIKILPKFRKKEIVTLLDEGIPPILFDKQQVQQVLLNLVKNAYEASDDVTITITTQLNRETNEVRISVSDNGPGIPPEVKKVMFTKKITTKENGHGYGLPICKKIVENHNGRIEVVSEVNKGTSFHLIFPAEGKEEV